MSLPRYPEYKDSGIGWLGEVPAHWEVVPLKHSFQIVGGSTPKSEKSEYWDGSIVWVSPADLSKLTSIYIDDSARKITDEGLASCGTTLVPVGSVVLSTRAPIGSLAIAATRLCTNQGCKALVPSNAVNSRFFAYVLLAATDELNIRGRGTTFLELSANELGAFKAPRPSCDEQTAITTFLDRETVKINALIAEQEKLLALLAEKRQATISHAVTKGLNPEAPMKDSGVAWLGEVPEHWAEIPIKALFRQQKRQNFPDKEVLSVYRDHGVVRKDSRTDNLNKTPDDLSSYQLVEQNDLVVNKMKGWQGSLGVSEFEGITSPDYMVFSPLHTEDPTFLHILLRSSPLVSTYRSISNGIRPAQWRLEPEQFLRTKIYLPPIEEQETIVSYCLHEIAKLDGLKAESERAITLLKERRSALIDATVTGQIDVRQT